MERTERETVIVNGAALSVASVPFEYLVRQWCTACRTSLSGSFLEDLIWTPKNEFDFDYDLAALVCHAVGLAKRQTCRNRQRECLLRIDLL